MSFVFDRTRRRRVLVAAVLALAATHCFAQAPGDHESAALAAHEAVHEKFVGALNACGIGVAAAGGTTKIAAYVADSAVKSLAARLAGVIGVAVAGGNCTKEYVSLDATLRQNWLKLVPDARLMFLRLAGAGGTLDAVIWMLGKPGDLLDGQLITGKAVRYRHYADQFSAAYAGCLRETADGADPEHVGACAALLGDSPTGGSLRRMLAYQVKYNACLGRHWRLYAAAGVPMEEITASAIGTCSREAESTPLDEIRATPDSVREWQLRQALAQTGALPAFVNPDTGAMTDAWRALVARGAGGTGLAELTQLGAWLSRLRLAPDHRQLLYVHPDPSIAPFPIANDGASIALSSGGSGIDFYPRLDPLSGRPIGALIVHEGKLFLLNLTGALGGQASDDRDDWTLTDGAGAIHRITHIGAEAPKVPVKNGREISLLELRRGNPAATPKPVTEVVMIVASDAIGAGAARGAPCQPSLHARCVELPTGPDGAKERWRYSEGVFYQWTDARTFRYVDPHTGVVATVHRDPNGQLTVVTPNADGTLRAVRTNPDGSQDIRTVYPGGYHDARGVPRYVWCLPPIDGADGRRLCNRLDGSGWYTGVDGAGTPDPTQPPAQYAASVREPFLGSGPSLGEMFFGRDYDGAFAGIPWLLSTCSASACSNNPGATTVCFGVTVPVNQANEICGRIARERAEEALRASFRYGYEVLRVDGVPAAAQGGARAAVEIALRNSGGHKTYPWLGPFYGIELFFAPVDRAGERAASQVLTLPPDARVAPGAAEVFRAELVMPLSAGRYELRARMLKDVVTPGTSQFGPVTALGIVDVAPAAGAIVDARTYRPQTTRGAFVSMFAAGRASRTDVCAAADPTLCELRLGDRFARVVAADGAFRFYAPLAFVGPLQVNVHLSELLPAGRYEITLIDALSGALVASDRIAVDAPAGGGDDGGGGGGDACMPESVGRICPAPERAGRATWRAIDR